MTPHTLKDVAADGAFVHAERTAQLLAAMGTEEIEVGYTATGEVQIRCGSQQTFTCRPLATLLTTNGQHILRWEEESVRAFGAEFGIAELHGDVDLQDPTAPRIEVLTAAASTILGCPPVLILEKNNGEKMAVAVKLPPHHDAEAADPGRAACLAAYDISRLSLDPRRAALGYAALRSIPAKDESTPGGGRVVFQTGSTIEFSDSVITAVSPGDSRERIIKDALGMDLEHKLFTQATLGEFNALWETEPAEDGAGTVRIHATHTTFTVPGHRIAVLTPETWYFTWPDQVVRRDQQQISPGFLAQLYPEALHRRLPLIMTHSLDRKMAEQLDIVSVIKRISGHWNCVFIPRPAPAEAPQRVEPTRWEKDLADAQATTTGNDGAWDVVMLSSLPTALPPAQPQVVSAVLERLRQHPLADERAQRSYLQERSAHAPISWGEQPPTGPEGPTRGQLR